MAVLLSYPYGFIRAIQNIGQREYTIDDIAMRDRVSGSIYGGTASYIAAFAFEGCTAITGASFPNVTSIGGTAFRGCTALTDISFPNATSIAAFAFAGCTALTTANFPKATYIGMAAFSGCIALTTASFPKATSIEGSTFAYCNNLLSLYLNSIMAVPSLKNSAFYSTPIGGYTASTGGVYGSVFVPASLYSSFLTATNWSSISARIVSI